MDDRTHPTQPTEPTHPTQPTPDGRADADDARWDDELVRFAADGVAQPPADDEGFVAHDGARIRYASHGDGPPVVLLHGGLGHGGNWGYQVPTLVAAGYRAVVIDSRGHGRSTRDERPFVYERMAGDVVAVLDALGIRRAAFVGWSDGAVVALIVALQAPARVASVFFFSGAMDLGGLKALEIGPRIRRCLGRHVADYRALSATPDAFDAFAAAVQTMMSTQPDYDAATLATIAAPVAIVQADDDEFIDAKHAAYLARTIPGATLVALHGVSHFAPLQRPRVFDDAMLAFLGAHPSRD